ncbi:putative ribosome biogenesis GTPase RsgA 2 [Desulfamplus magnetovallimortis]|uniref:Small ribosomal subunit biogenesis GTPase RsgA n=1 Tax=Desulfamplus magnetovallimortis TaxID=1246637 RepID=A0A1W1HCX1_9BACT|nr:ribosome small subunit-dependent GTPase A [Desulfamplus magnetovallimortis]SLM30286.1 putative ribosome biogenesis GTPase RsgA 2 [Desulfamplus magnetovallimortis]
MELEDLGYNDTVAQSMAGYNLDGLEPGRVVAEHRERYIVRTAAGEFDAEILGNLRFSAKGREDFPAVGDWVALSIYDSDFAIIHRILPRFSLLSRQAVGQFGEVQIIAANVDCAFLVQAIDRDFSINRFERYLTVCHSSSVSPVIVLTKTDLIDQSKKTELIELVKSRISDVPVIAVSNKTLDGYEDVKKLVERGKSYCMLGSSGVGKSTLLNNLAGKTVMRTDEISNSSNRGRHVTTHRELIVLESGGIVIDNPGMREFGIADSSFGLETAFDNIINFAQECKYNDCTHTNEKGCAVIDAVEKGKIDSDSYENYLKMERERAHFASTVAERRKKGKDLAKTIKSFKKNSMRIAT